ncbi:MAG: hypothetical protein H6732_01900 [Alphaproteobacteria bacterium]|nr:hypothetical protein [Alphaproteobacteria bacterium]
MTQDFDRLVCAPVRAHLGRPVRLPSAGDWRVDTVRGVPTLTLTLPHATLGRNLQTTHAAAPAFLACFGWWHGRLTGTDPALHLDIVGDEPADPSARRHARRARIALEALTVALGDRLTTTGLEADPWPRVPVFNAPKEARGSELGGGGREHQVEVQLADEPEHARTLPVDDVRIDGFQRQLPLGLFEGTVAHDARWTPGNKAQADLWATSPDGRVFHLFELKVADNDGLGILPELLCYLWLVHRARVGLPDGRRLTGGGAGLDAARRAERLVGWTLAPDLHPLLGTPDATPLSWIAEGLRPHMDLGMLGFHDPGGPRGFGGWRPERTWRSWAAA